jgi:hypothetical protein
MTSRKLVALVVVLAAVLVLPAPAVAEKTIGLSTSKFEFSVGAGQKGSGELFVLNDGSEPLRVLVYSANQVVDEKGEIAYEIPSRTSPGFGKDPASWMSIKTPTSTKTIGNTPLLELAPGDRVPIEFDFTVPQNVAPGDHQVILFFEMLGDAENTGVPTAVIAGRLGARVRIRVQGQIVERMDVQPFSIRNLVVGNAVPYTFIIKNDGNVDKVVKGRLLLLDGDENEVFSSDVVTETVVYANTSSERTGVATPKGLFGRYTARLAIGYLREGASPGQEVADSVVKDRTIWIVPLWLVIAVVAIVGGALIYGSWRQAVRAAERRTRATRRKQVPLRPEPQFDDEGKLLDECEGPAE